MKYILKEQTNGGQRERESLRMKINEVFPSLSSTIHNSHRRSLKKKSCCFLFDWLGGNITKRFSSIKGVALTTNLTFPFLAIKNSLIQLKLYKLILY